MQTKMEWNFIISILFSTQVFAIHPLQFFTKQLQNSNLKENDFIFIGGKYFYNGEKPEESYNSTETAPLWFHQCMDHDNECDQKWRQRYWINSLYYRQDGPIFFMFGGEGNASGFVDAGIWKQYAKKYGALMLCLEHRFYGESFPTLNTSFTDMKLLTSQQALADAAIFLEWVKIHYNMKDAKVIVFGGSYPGNLAAWMRMKYPKLVQVAVASSAPLEARFSNSDYFRTVSDVIYQLDENCYWKIYDTFKCMRSIINGDTCTQSNYSKSELPRALHQCDNYNLDMEWDKQIFFHRLGARWGSNFPGHKSATKCFTLTLQDEKDIIDNYAKYLVDIGLSPATCPPHSVRRRTTDSQLIDNIIEFIKKIAGDARNAKSWTWQTCYEFGYYQVADHNYKLFSDVWDTTIDVKRCQLAFSDAEFTAESIKARIAATNDYYGGKRYNGTCTIFINGQWDPWHKLGINDEIAKNTVISIPQAEHCEDMFDSPAPSAFMVEAQAKIQYHIGKYLEDPNC